MQTVVEVRRNMHRSSRLHKAHVCCSRNDPQTLYSFRVSKQVRPQLNLPPVPVNGATPCIRRHPEFLSHQCRPHCTDPQNSPPLCSIGNSESCDHIPVATPYPHKPRSNREQYSKVLSMSRNEKHHQLCGHC